MTCGMKFRQHHYSMVVSRDSAFLVEICLKKDKVIWDTLHGLAHLRIIHSLIKKIKCKIMWNAWPFCTHREKILCSQMSQLIRAFKNIKFVNKI